MWVRAAVDRRLKTLSAEQHQSPLSVDPSLRYLALHYAFHRVVSLIILGTCLYVDNPGSNANLEMGISIGAKIEAAISFALFPGLIAA